MDIEIRLAEEHDAAGMLKIYAPFISSTTVTFEYNLPDEVEFSERIKKITGNFPWLVAVNKNGLIGYAYACPHRERKAYEWSAEVSVYVAESFRGKGIAKNLYSVLFEVCRLQHLVHLYAGIALPNARSENFHRRMGFEPVGIYENIGYKLGRWNSVLWMHLLLSSLPEFPEPVIPFSEIRDSERCREILNKANEALSAIK